VSGAAVAGLLVREDAMPNGPDDLAVLRDALKVSPENIPLRLLLADKLLGRGQAEEAEKEHRHALATSADNAASKSGLAHAFYAQGKNDQAIVVIEGALKGGRAAPRLLLLHARLLLQKGNRTEAMQQYRDTIQDDPGLADAELANRLGLSEVPQEAREEQKAARPRAPVEPTELDEAPVERPTMTVQDVGGMEEVKDDIRIKIVHPLKHPELYAAYGKQVGGGILVYGPPGCGKTHLARATAGEAGISFMAIGINDILDMWVGMSERKLHAVFDQARDQALCLLFFDEVDALGSTYLMKADLLGDLGEQATALALYDRFLARWERLAREDESLEIRADLARACGNKAVLLSQQGRDAEALPLYEQALAIYQHLTGPAGQQTLVPALARACRNKAVAQCASGDPVAALEFSSRAVALLEPLVVCEGRSDLTVDLARAQRTQSHTFHALGQVDAALACARAATILHEQLVHEQGRWELGEDLIRSYRTEASALAEMQCGCALEVLDRAVLLGEHLIRDKR
jgi:tetratricopeptide (TPR) repeat protein